MRYLIGLINIRSNKIVNTFNNKIFPQRFNGLHSYIPSVTKIGFVSFAVREFGDIQSHIEELKKLINKRNEKRRQLYNKGEKIWDYYVSMVLIGIGYKV